VSIYKKTRLDKLLVDSGLAATRSRAADLVRRGAVSVAGVQALKPGALVRADAALTVSPGASPYVSRGGLKLAAALDAFGFEAKGRVALDLGASTGGFTDVLLAKGAARVHAVDVGRGQLAWKLRQDPRVVVHEGVNARYLSRAAIPEPIDFVTCDASFIGLATLLPAPLALTAASAALVALIKPQFEAGPSDVGKGGVVRDPAIHRAVCERIAAWVGAQPGWRVIGITESPITGPAGNHEFLIYARK
jgi:23S rRNA (cytidine1920-2'-O)/16S rRNA (cytidine1409-2'-O)-methyltransferase